MIKFFYEQAVLLKSKKKTGWKLVYKINKLMINLLFPLSAMWKPSLGTEEKSRIIISLTTYPARIQTVWITISSLLRQTMKPYKIILYLAEEQFSGHVLPRRLQRLQKYGLEICFVEDLKPHKKYFYAMQQYRDYNIITADDDIFYPENHIEKLWKGHEKYPDTVICCWSHRIEFDTKDNFVQYDDWSDTTEDRPSYATLAVGCNGVLYPPNSLPEDAFNQEQIIENSLYTDDLWLKCMEIRNDVKTVNCCKEALIYFNLLSTLRSGLWKNNTGEKRNNDLVWNKLMDKYPEVKKQLLQEMRDGQTSI